MNCFTNQRKQLTASSWQKSILGRVWCLPESAAIGRGTVALCRACRSISGVGRVLDSGGFHSSNSLVECSGLHRTGTPIILAGSMTAYNTTMFDCTQLHATPTPDEGQRSSIHQAFLALSHVPMMFETRT